MTASTSAPSEPSAPIPLAIVGMSCRMPGGVSSLEDFWSMLTNSEDGYKAFPKERFNWEAYYHPNQGRKDSINVHHGYFLDGDVKEFDAGFFKMNAIDATSFDPQGRIILECVYEALENAGVPKESIAGTKVGVFSTSNTSDYTLELKDDTPSMPSKVGVLGHNCMLSNVVSNVFDLRGPSVSVDTACSSAFYALQMAAQSLRTGETEMCVVSGCALNLSPWRWTMLSNLTMLHQDGITKALDPSADSGYARGEGAASIILKPLDKALRDNDRIHCVLSHIGVNHNGHTNGYTMPDAAMQATLMKELQAQIDVKPDEFGFIEAHAPGTRVGDPIEISALQKVFLSEARSPENPLLIGSVKANVGHLESSSGFPSLIKAALMLGKRQVVPNANFKDEAMNTELRKLHMAVPVSTQVWPEGKSYIAINNYGFGGSNAHAIIKAAPVLEAHADGADATSGEESFLFILSANDEQALAKTREQLVEFLESEDAADVKIHDLAYTLGQRRSQLSWRCAIVASNLDELSIQTASPRLVQRRVARQPKIAFAFTGQGAQYFGMGRELLQYPMFSAALEMCSACVESFGANFSLLEELYANEDTSRINDADVSQAASTAIQISIVDLLRSWSVEPMAVVGHSSGEVAAAYAAGLLSLPGAMRIAYARGQMAIRIKKVEPDFKGGMLAVAAGLEDVVPLLDIVTAGKVVVACENSPKSITVSGDEAALEELESLLEEDGLPHRRLAVDFPYHSPFLEPYVDKYEQDLCAADTFANTQQKAEYFSAMAGRRVDAAAVQKPSYWASSAKFRVRFTSATMALLKSKTPPEVMVEIGPHPMLTGAVKSILKVGGKQVTQMVETLPSLQRGQGGRTCMVKLAEGLYSLGQTIDLEQVNMMGGKENGSRPRLVDGLRPYPWTRNRYWIESRIRDDAMLRPFPRHDLLGYANKGASGEGAWSWRNNFQGEDVPWLRGYQVGPFTTFPLAGYVCAALEASKQRAVARGADVLTGFTVRDVRILNSLVLDEGARIELIANLDAQGEGGYEAFELSSWNEGQRTWVQHCRALVRCHGAEVEEMATPACEDWADARAACRTRVGSPLLYQGSAKNGPVRTGVFRNVHNLRFGSGKTTAEVVVSDTAAEMPLHYETDLIIHPTTLDGLLHLARMPDALDHAAAAALPATLGAAQLALVEVGRLCAGERVLILEPDSALGRAAVQIAKAAGATVSTPVASDALDAAPPADLLFRPSPGALGPTHRLAPFGRFVYMRSADNTHRGDATPCLAPGCSAAGVHLSSVAAALPQRIAAVLDAVAGLFARGLVSSAPAVSIVGLERLSEALKAAHSSPNAETLVLVPTPGEMIRTTPARPAPPTFDPAAVYLLIGGGGGLGRVIAQWMVDSGAKHVGLLSRSTSMSPEVRVLVDNAATQGANIFLLPCDVTKREQLQKVIDQCDADRGPIKGVINAAMVFKGAVFNSVSHADFMQVAHPKVAGTWNLHHALKNAPLDFFVLISSVAGVMGTAGHSAYAAANTFLDSFARYRMRQGLPASSLALTAVVDAGYMAENTEKLQKLKYVDEFAGEILTTPDVLALLGAAVNGEVASSCHGYSITGAGFGTARKLPAHAKDPRFSALLSRHAKEQATTTNTSSLARALDQADDKAEATRLLLNAIRSKVAELQLIPVMDIFDNQTIVELGLDSLTAMELYSWIGRVFRMKFRVQEYAKLDTLEKIADSVMVKRDAAEVS